MNVLDILILIVAVLFGLNGFYRGFIHQIFFFVSIFAGLAGAMYASPYVGEIFSFATQNLDLQRLLGFALSFVLITVLVGLIARLIHRGARLVALGFIDHLLGAIFGAGAALLFAAFGVFVMKALLPADSKFVRGSTLAPYAESVAKSMLALVPDSLQRRFQDKLWELRTGRPSSPPAGAPASSGIVLPGATPTPLAPFGQRAAAPPSPPPPPVRTTYTVVTPHNVKHLLVDARARIKTLRVDMRYASTENFLRRRLYPVSRCLLAPSVAKRLAAAQKALRRRKLGLKVWDCYRPLSIQRDLFAAMPQPGYVSDPRVGSNHNRAAAVDVTLVDAAGRELAMPTDFDEFTPRAHQGAPASPAARANREILRAAMVRAGFQPLPTEWWHFDAPDAARLPLLDTPFQEIP